MIFGIIALVKTKDGRQRGRGLAIAGTAISGLWVVGLIAALAALHFTSLVAGTVESGESLMVGQCVDETPNPKPPEPKSVRGTLSVAINHTPMRSSRCSACLASPRPSRITMNL
ncbi:DUF4190 domain-containing protein [Mycobacterium sp.]|uniref:DUF4190 domain-containing protein n=1 Tax=Mycobacterium sp. TaxID=1785 RepID=UPI003C73B73A